MQIARALIVVAVLAAWKGVTLDATNHGELKQELKRIAPETVRHFHPVLGTRRLC